MKIQRFVLVNLNALFPQLYPAFRLLTKGAYLRSIFEFYKDYLKYIALDKKIKSPFKVNILNTHPIYFDRYDEAGSILQHYFHQDIWAAAKVFKSGVKTHYDIGSRLDGFISHCLAFTKVVMLDIRPLDKKIQNLSFIQTDGTNMKNIKSNTISSISSLHAIEHFGLGRYGDPIDPLGYKKAIDEIKRVTKKGGNIYFSVPIGKQRLEFNNQRVFNPKYVMELFSGMKLKEFSLVDDNNNFVSNVKPEKYVKVSYSCGLFHFQKP